MVTHSSAKLPRGLRNNNPLNIRKNPNNKWQGAVKGSDPEFETFTNCVWGVRAAFIIIRNYIKNPKLPAKTIAGIIARWAPPSENNTAAYISRVCQLASVYAIDKADFANKAMMCSLVKAMIIVENGKQYESFVPSSSIERAYDLAASR